MALPGNKNFSDYDNYITDTNPTTSAQAQDYFRNQAELLKAVIDCDFWQPETTYQPGDVVKSDSMPNGTEAVMVATKASVTSNVEPQWGAVGGANVSDGACFWKLRWQHWSKENATNRLPNTTYAVGDVMLHKSNLSVSLKCTTAGTTSNTELDISGKSIGDTVTDGSVVWEVVKRFNGASDKLTFETIFEEGFDLNSLTQYKRAIYTVNSSNVAATFLNCPTKAAFSLEVIPIRNAFLIQRLTVYNTSEVYVRGMQVDGGTTWYPWRSVGTDVGTIIMFAGDTPPAGYLACGGEGLKSTSYLRLFSVIGTKFGSGDGVNTDFNLPNLNNGSFAEGSDTVGTVKSAGLPNITASFDIRSFGQTRNMVFSPAGAFEFWDSEYADGAYPDDRGGKNALEVYFNASKSNSIYGNSNTVQPKSVTVKYCIKY